ncbi:uncharacterized protein Tco025E_03318 [Trypanosoma conorhini]|uniref:Transmembrane protein n=1 Tax=Trypanosoma conorhini TaxID=83891 RepID=A0A422PWA4_9TRYP|nr:uncharacterized protein Tco025E_03318 [Trypanosoma conorhini]RNF22035.1 hypothetical protein Tco025E_03318 [Trypanosoma conorhini]
MIAINIVVTSPEGCVSAFFFACSPGGPYPTPLTPAGPLVGGLLGGIPRPRRLRSRSCAGHRTVCVRLRRGGCGNFVAPSFFLSCCFSVPLPPPLFLFCCCCCRFCQCTLLLPLFLPPLPRVVFLFLSLSLPPSLSLCLCVHFCVFLAACFLSLFLRAGGSSACARVPGGVGGERVRCCSQHSRTHVGCCRRRRRRRRRRGGRGRPRGGDGQHDVAAKGAVDDARRDPSKELGISAEELQRRRKQASSPRTFVSEHSSRAFEVKGSARAQQIMNAGLLERQRETRNTEVVRKMSVLRRVQLGTFCAGIAMACWLGVEYLLPRYAVVQERRRVMQLRREMAQRKWEEAEAQRRQR